ncbi:MAG: hypothetical protein WC998_08645 [Candidatus Paceibacterota bacterium]|jgi:hypothetical protein
MSVNTNPTCPSGCTGEIPDAQFSFCSPTNLFGEITHLFIASAGTACFTDEAILAEWLGRLDNSGGGIEAIRYFHVSADMPAGAGDVIETSLNRKAKGPKTFTINVDVDDITSLNYEFMRATQCNQTFKIWYASAGFLYGGACGIDANVNLDYVIARGTKSIQKITGVVTWDSQYAPERVVNPLSGASILTT